MSISRSNTLILPAIKSIQHVSGTVSGDAGTTSNVPIATVVPTKSFIIMRSVMSGVIPTWTLQATQVVFNISSQVTATVHFTVVEFN